MKKLNLKTLLFSTLVFLSICSYVYINSVNVTTTVKCKTVEILDDEDHETKGSILPEVQIVKKLLEKGREVLPATRF